MWRWISDVLEHLRVAHPLLDGAVVHDLTAPRRSARSGRHEPFSRAGRASSPPARPTRLDRPQLTLSELAGESLRLGRRLEPDQKVKSSMPPLTFSATPVMYEARSEQRKTIAFATSCGSPRRRRAVRLIIRSCISGFTNPNASVPITPGTIALHVIPCRAPSSASVRVRPSRPAFVVE